MASLSTAIRAVLGIVLMLHGIAGGAAASTLPAGFVESDIGAGWSEPAGIAFDPDPARANRAYVWERGGKVWIVENGIKQAAPLIDLSEEVGAWRDLGLLGFAIDPAFSQNGYVYLFYVVDRHHLLYAGTPSYNPTGSDLSPPTIGRITRYTVRSTGGFQTVDAASRKILLGETKSSGVPVLNESHSIGMLAFALDGTLLVSTGDGGSFEVMDDGGDVGNSRATIALADGIISPKENVGAFRSQLIDSHSGKILRIDPETGDGVPSNPYYDPAAPRAARSRVWALGFRNPYRFTIRPETGSHDPAAGNPGVLVIGDVGWSNWEDIHVVERAGVNCGWPLFEGLTNNTNYFGSEQVNMDAPNPLGGYFRFRDLIVQETADTPSWPNPGDPSQQVPDNVPHFMHSRPVIDYGRNFTPAGPVRTGIFNETTAWQAVIGEPDSPVAGPQFAGSCSTGGVFYAGTEFPSPYRGTYFHADYGKNWIKNIVFGADNRPVEVRDFAEVDTPVFVATHPTTGGLYYVSFVGNTVRRIDYAPAGNRSPVAKATASVMYGASPLSVNFSSAGSIDPDGTALSYLWTFGDGTTSTAPNPSKTFTATGAKRFDVNLRVADPSGGYGETTLAIFVNHTPPVVEILSPVDGTKYALDANSTYSLVRRATAAAGRTSTTRWQVFLHHDEHEHPEPPVDAVETSAVITPIHSDTGTFYYRVVCTVTDDLGASTERVSLIQPNVTNAAPHLAWSIASQNRSSDAGPFLLDPNATISDSDSLGVEFGKLQVSSSAGGDTLSLLPQGEAAGQVNVAGDNVRYGGVAVGTYSGGSAGQPLVVSLASTATPAIAQAILRRVALQCSGPGARSLTATLDDGDGATGLPGSIAVNVANAVPTVTLTNPAAGSIFPPRSSVVLAAEANDTDGGIARVEFYSGATKLGEDTTVPFSFTWEEVPPGTYLLTARAVDDLNATATSQTVSIIVESPGVLPAEWKPKDVGAAFTPGSTEYAGGAYTLVSAGSGYSTSDSFHFLSQALDGDGEIVARINSIDMLSAGASAGLMIRENRGALARYALLAMGQAGGVFQWRPQPGAAARQRPISLGGAPQWLRLVRHGSRCSGYVSVDGNEWSQVWTIALLLPSRVFAGLAITSGANDGTTARAVFDHVEVHSVTSSPLPPAVRVMNPSTASTFVAPSPITFDFAAADPDGGIGRVDLFRGSTKIGSDSKAPFSVTWNRSAPGTHTFHARAVDFTGLKTISEPITVTVQPAPTTLPAPWSIRDLGNAVQLGAAEFGSGMFTVTSSGDDLLYKTDQACFVWQPWNGDGTLIARVASVSPTTATSLGGVVFRENFAANSRSFAAVLTHGEGAHFQARTEAGIDSEAGNAKSVVAPQWLRVMRRGQRFSAAVSPDAVNWTGLGARTIPMSAECKVGLLVCAGSGGRPATVTFENVTLSAPGQE